MDMFPWETPIPEKRLLKNLPSTEGTHESYHSTKFKNIKTTLGTIGILYVRPFVYNYEDIKPLLQHHKTQKDTSSINKFFVRKPNHKANVATTHMGPVAK